MEPNKWQQTLTSDYWTGTPTSMSGGQQTVQQQADGQHYLGAGDQTHALGQPAFGAGQLARLHHSNTDMLAMSPAPNLDDDDYAVPSDDNCCRLDRSQVELVQLIGEGQKGYVFLGKLQSRDGRQMVDVAIKTLKYETEQLIERLMSEAALMRSLEHPHIIRFIGMCPETPALIAMELAKFGEIKQYLKLNQHLIRCSQLVLFAFQISTALSYLESKNFVHRDVAARNVLVCSHQCVKLADFGLSRNLLQQQAAQLLTPEHQHQRQCNSELGAQPSYNNSKMVTTRNSQLADMCLRQHDEQAQYVAAPRVKLPVRWLAPESLVFRRFTSASDVWMFAVCTWELFQWGHLRPWPELRNSQVLAAIESGQRLGRPDACPTRLYQLMLQCWSYAPMQRPKFREIKQSIWSIYLSERTREQFELERMERERQRLLLVGAQHRQQAACMAPMILGGAESVHQYYMPPEQSTTTTNTSTTDDSEGAPACSPVQSTKRSGASGEPQDSGKTNKENQLPAAALETANRRFAWIQQQPQQQLRGHRPGRLQKQRSQGAIVSPPSDMQRVAAPGRQQRLRKGHDDGELWRRQQQSAWRRSQPLEGASDELESDGAHSDADYASYAERLQVAKRAVRRQRAVNRAEINGKQIWPQQQHRLVSASPALTQASMTGSVCQPAYEGLSAASMAASSPGAEHQFGRVAMLQTACSPALLGMHSATPSGSVSPSSASPRPTSWRAGLGTPATNQQPQLAKQPTTHELGQVLQALRITPMKAKLKYPPEQTVRVLAPARQSPTDSNNSNKNDEQTELDHSIAAEDRLRASDIKDRERLQLHQRLLNRMIRSTPARLGAGSGNARLSGAAQTARQTSVETVDQSLQILESLMVSPSLGSGAQRRRQR